MDLMMTKWTTIPSHAPFAMVQNQRLIHVAVNALIRDIYLHCNPDSDYSKLRSRVDKTSQTQTPIAALNTPSSTT